MGKATTMREHVAHGGKNPYNGIKNVGLSKEGETQADLLSVHYPDS